MAQHEMHPAGFLAASQCHTAEPTMLKEPAGAGDVVEKFSGLKVQECWLCLAAHCSGQLAALGPAALVDTGMKDVIADEEDLLSKHSPA